MQIDTENHCVIPRDGAAAFYGKCIYALGADCFVPPIPGVGMAGALTVRKLQILKKVHRACLNAKAAICVATYQSSLRSIVVHTVGASLYAIGNMGKNVNDAYRLLTGELPQRTNIVHVNETHSVKRTHFTACILNEILIGMCIVGDLSYLGLARDTVNNSLQQENFLRLWKERGASANEA